MVITVGSEIRIQEPTPEVVTWARKELTVPNPEYAKKRRMGLWTGKTDPQICFYYIDGDTLVIPCGAGGGLQPYLTAGTRMVTDLADNGLAEYPGNVPLYGYQQAAVGKMAKAGRGILQSPCGSGKTQMGIALAAGLRRKTLWVTHTQDLLNQSYNRARQYFPEGMLGKIAGGKVQIGSHMTFATVQTLSKLDLERYKYTWDVVIVDECFPAGTMIATRYGDKPIEEVNAGDMVLTYNHTKCRSEFRQVENLQVRVSGKLVKVMLKNGKTIVCTENHPFYTRCGEYKKAVNLIHDDEVYCLREGVRYCDLEQDTAICDKTWGKIPLLLKRMLKKGESDAQYLDGRAQGNQPSDYGEDKQGWSIGTDEKEQSFKKTGSEGENISDFERNWPSAASTYGKWNGINKATGNDDECTGNVESTGGVFSKNRNAKSHRLSHVLQDRCCYSSREDCNRNRWRFARFAESTGCRCAERRIFTWERVESVEVQEQRSNGASGRVRPGSLVYNLSVKKNHNYFANGVLVHNCHRVSGGPTSVRMFYRVMSHLAARHKFGLSATVHRSDGLIRSTFAIIGPVVYRVPEKAVAEKTMKVTVKKRETGLELSRMALDTDGTLAYAKLIPYLTGSQERNGQIIRDLVENAGRSNLILSDRLEHLHILMGMLPEGCREAAVMIDGGMTSKSAKAARERAIEEMRTGEKHFLFASYSLAKEGLDIPRLDRLYLATPKKDYAVVTQSIGRIARVFEGKRDAVCYDYVDAIGFCENQYRRRKASYRKAGCIISE